MKKEAKDWVLDPNSNDIFPRVVPHYHNWLSQYGAVSWNLFCLWSFKMSIA